MKPLAPEIREVLQDSAVANAIRLMGEVEERCVRARLAGKRARLSVTCYEWATIRDTLTNYERRVADALAEAEEA